MNKKTTTPPVDADNNGPGNNNGQFVEGNQAAADPVPVEEAITLAELELIAAVEQLMVAGAAFAKIPETPVFYVGDGYRIRFAGHELLEVTRG